MLLLDDPALRGRVLRARARWQEYVRSLREIYRRRRDVMLDALAEHFPREAEWTYPQGGLFIWATLPDYIDTTDLLARALQEHVAFVPGRAAFLDGRGGSSMRLNFSGVGEDDIREGVRRIGKVVREQVGLYGTLTGRSRAPAQRPATPRRRDARRTRRRRCTCRAARAPRGERDAASRCSRAGARSSARSRCGRARGSRTRSSASATRSSPIDVGADLVARLRAPAPDVAFVALHGRDGEDGTVQELLEVVGHALHRLGRLGLHPLLPTRCWPSTRMRDAGIPTPDFYAFNETAFRELGAAEALPAIEERLRSRSSSSPPGRARRWGSSSPAPPPTSRPRWWRRSPTTARCCSSATSPGATWRCRSSHDGRGAADRRGGARRRGLLRLRGALRDRPHRRSCARPTARGDVAARAQDARAARCTRLLGCRASPAWT